MKFGYTSRGKGGATEAEQHEALKDVGVTKIFDEGVPYWPPHPHEGYRQTRIDLIEILRPGDQLCVYSAAHFARDAADLFTALAAVSAKQASLYVIDMAKDFTASEDQAALARAFTGDKRRAQTAAAREAPRKNRGGRPPALVLSGADKAEFIRMWRDEAVDKKMMARRFKCSVATIGRRADDLNLSPKA